MFGICPDREILGNPHPPIPGMKSMWLGHESVDRPECDINLNCHPGRLVLCAGQVPVVPVHTTAAVRGTMVRGSLGSAGLPQWSQTQAYASNVYWFTPVSSCCS